MSHKKAVPATKKETKPLDFPVTLITYLPGNTGIVTWTMSNPLPGVKKPPEDDTDGSN